MREKINGIRKELLIVGIIVLTSTASFLLGRISVVASPRTPVRIEYDATSTTALMGNTGTPAKKIEGTTGPFFASKNGKKYYPTDCAGGKRVKIENRIYFQTPQEAELLSFSLASGCTLK